MNMKLTFKIGASVTRFELCSNGVCLNVGAKRAFQSSFYHISQVRRRRLQGLTGRFCSNNKVKATFSLDHPPSASLPYALSMTSVKASSAHEALDASRPSTAEMRVYQALSFSQPFLLPNPTNSPVTTLKSSIFAVSAKRAPELTIAVRPNRRANRKSRFS